MSDNVRTPWCLVDGDSMVFDVTAPANVSISRLKELVQKKGDRGILRDVDAKDLVLWKVSIF